MRFTADDIALRPMGRATSGVTGMKFREGDQPPSMDVVRDDDDAYVFVVTEGGYAKRTPVEEYRIQGRGGLGSRSPSSARSAATWSARSSSVTTTRCSW